MTSLLEVIDARIAELKAIITNPKTASYIVNQSYQRMQELEQVRQKVVEIAEQMQVLEKKAWKKSALRGWAVTECVQLITGEKKDG